jgi:hypothetical protein
MTIKLPVLDRVNEKDRDFKIKTGRYWRIFSLKIYIHVNSCAICITLSNFYTNKPEFFRLQNPFARPIFLQENQRLNFLTVRLKISGAPRTL